MSFLRHLLPAWKRGIEDKRSANAAILAAVDRELKDTEQETIKSKLLMSLNSSEGEWLDQYGKLFGLLRKENETDETYRNRIIAYILLKRGTIPAIKAAIQEFLGDYGDYIEIYEPYKNVFTLNKSKLNGPDHFLGEYYRVAVIDIKISRPFPIGIIDVINEFKPAGVTFRLTYQPNTYNDNAEVVKVPFADSQVLPFEKHVRIMHGMNASINGHMNMTNTSKTGTNNGLFQLNDSKLNSLDRLAGSLAAANSMYNLATYSISDLAFTNETSMADVLTTSTQMSSDFYTKTGSIDSQYAAQELNNSISNYLYFTMDVATHFSLQYSKFLKEVEPSGVYTKETYASLMGGAYLQHSLSVVTSTNIPYRLQVLNMETASWEDIEKGNASTQYKTNTASLGDTANYLSDQGIMFTRLKFFPEPGVAISTYSGIDSPDGAYSVILDGDSVDDQSADIILSGGYQKAGVPYDVRVNFFELGFTKEIAVRPTVTVFDGTATHGRIVTEAP
ncbi:baseplate protein [Bacillus phage Moonbeam]|uniref:Baseplate protein n=1 Tax=Bacillus phage Moonbeam TaxID=1540091 RepID=A0A0A0RSJ3_9CAUD|nr:baseplate protein [Bacillus phage Moonbeam]AIW03481.1 baseplate protein [Bacillus phage Moonbeam]